MRQGRSGLACGRRPRVKLDVEVRGCGNVALEAAQQRGETGAAADGDDAKLAGWCREHGIGMSVYLVRWVGRRA